MAKLKEGFETKLEKLQAISTQLESGKLTLDEMLEAFEKGTALYRECNLILEEAEAKVNLIINEVETEPFEIKEEN
ncbi:MAG: exodeoxyribonuclease small subunit [Clostridiales bacterium]|nr:exodeoxyribonuclease small subunit [Clostridiales bacterium]MDN5300257.1 exodeoxyribonuclease small subunit [Clostridiales bacterium]